MLIWPSNTVNSKNNIWYKPFALIRGKPIKAFKDEILGNDIHILNKLFLSFIFKYVNQLRIIVIKNVKESLENTILTYE